MCMEDPVMASDGHTYERYAIEEWFAHSSTSPVTNLAMSSKILTSNMAVKSITAKYWKTKADGLAA